MALKTWVFHFSTTNGNEEPQKPKEEAMQVDVPEKAQT